MQNYNINDISLPLIMQSYNVNNSRDLIVAIDIDHLTFEESIKQILQYLL